MCYLIFVLLRPWKVTYYLFIYVFICMGWVTPDTHLWRAPTHPPPHTWYGYQSNTVLKIRLPTTEKNYLSLFLLPIAYNPGRLINMCSNSTLVQWRYSTAVFSANLRVQLISNSCRADMLLLNQAQRLKLPPVWQWYSTIPRDAAYYFWLAIEPSLLCMYHEYRILPLIYKFVCHGNLMQGMQGSWWGRAQIMLLVH